MPATPRQVEANRRNAARSTGPRTAEGKARSRRNALTHGLAGRGVVRPEEESAAITERAAQWHSSLRPVNVYEEWLLEVAAAESLRYERCLAEEAALRGRLVERAETSWDDDRALAAEALARGLAADPGLVVRKLRQTSQGAALLIGRLGRLIARLADAGRPWTETDESELLDLLGVACDDRDGPDATLDDPDRRAAWSEVLGREIAELSARKAAVLDPRDEAERADAAANLFPEPPAELRRLHRYRRGILRDLNRAVEGIKHRRPSPVVVPEAPMPRPEPAASAPSWSPSVIRGQIEAIRAASRAVERDPEDSRPSRGPSRLARLARDRDETNPPSSGRDRAR